MKLKTLGFAQILLFLKEKVNLFYILAVAPIFLILYYNGWILGIAFYGFLFLFLKNQKLQSAKEPRYAQRVLGFIVIISSFLVYYALVLVIPTAGFYGAQNYIVYLFGLFLIFFDWSALREAFTPLFFITAATGSSFVADLLEPILSPHLGDIANIIVKTLSALGINASISYDSNLPTISFRSLSGNFIAATFAYGCIGVFSALVFSIILVVVLFEDPSSWKVRILASIIAVSGTFALNIVRVTGIFLTDYFYGAEAGATVHYVIGYAFFSAWLIVFLYVYSKRKTIQVKIQSLSRKPNLPKT
jgi:exosortase/archaeosortase family protein